MRVTINYSYSGTGEVDAELESKEISTVSELRKLCSKWVDKKMPADFTGGPALMSQKKNILFYTISYQPKSILASIVLSIKIECEPGELDTIKTGFKSL